MLAANPTGCAKLARDARPPLGPAYLTSHTWRPRKGYLRTKMLQKRRSQDPVCAKATNSPSVDKTAEYNKTMNQQMGWGNLNPYEYHPERGLYYHEIVPNLFCGCQPRNKAEVHTLKHTEKVTHIVNLQQDKDMQYWGVKLEEIRHACSEVGIQHIRRPARDFDPNSVRKTIPGAVQAIHGAMSTGGRVYVHCTAGLGRAPAVVIAYLYWFCNMDLDEAYKHLTDRRPCGPKKDAIRGATYDVLANASKEGGFENLPKDSYSKLSEEDRYALQYRVLKGAW